MPVKPLDTQRITRMRSTQWARIVEEKEEEKYKPSGKGWYLKEVRTDKGISEVVWERPTREMLND